MKNTFGNSISLTLFGESHGPAVGAVIDGLAPGITVDREYIEKLLDLRRPVGKISTPRQEADRYEILSGVFEGKTTGTPLCIVIFNEDTRSEDYSATRNLARPSHADYTANLKYHGFEDPRGGGHFSGRITAALVAVGGIIIPALRKKGIYIGTHIKKCAGVLDRDFSDDPMSEIEALGNREFAVLDDAAGEKMIAAIMKARADGDSVGGILETVVLGMPRGVGEPFFDTVEGLLAHALYSVPAVKGVEFGGGFALSDMTGSEANDPFYMKDGEILTKTNNSGGVNGGITNGMPLIFRCAVKPTPTISKEQNTVDMMTKTDAVLAAKGRHDPSIVHRARVVIDAVTALTLADMLCARFGTDWLTEI